MKRFINACVVIFSICIIETPYAMEESHPGLLINQNVSAQLFDFNTIPPYHLTNKIDMRFITSSQFTVIQWDLMAGAKLLPVHSHLNEQVIRVIKGELEVHTGNDIYTIHEGQVMVFPPYVTHGFVALTDTIMYEQQTPVRQDFLQKDFIKNLSDYLSQHQ